MKSIKKLKLERAQGFDGIGAEFYKNTANVICPVFCSLFNHILNTGVFPDMRGERIIVPFHKNGSKMEPTNYI